MPIEGSDKQVITIKATPRKDKLPFLYRGTPYLRNEAQIKQMPVEIYKQRLLKSSGFSSLWEAIPAQSKYTIDMLDSDAILSTMKLALAENRIPANLYTEDVKEALISLDMIDDDGALNNAAIIAFAKPMRSDYTQCFIRMGRFTDESMNHILDTRQIRGNALELLEEAENFVQKHLPIASRYEPNKMERVDEPALPFQAIREAIVNALIHRDYSNPAGDIALFIFNTHFEIHNIGHLYADMTIPKLKKRHTSRQRNPRIAHVFWTRKLIERHGSGTLRMIELCEQQGLEPPEFSEAGDGFMVKFYFKEPIGPHRAIVHERVGQYHFSDREKELLDILSLQGKSTLKDIMIKLKNPPTDRTIRTVLSSLRNKGYISSEGYGRGASWFLLNNEENK